MLTLTAPADILTRQFSHIKRVFGYARPSDYAKGAVAATIPPGLFWAMEHWHPSYVGKGGFAPIMRLTVAMGLTFGTVWVYTRSCSASTPAYSVVFLGSTS
jgi:hypothetical protein